MAKILRKVIIRFIINIFSYYKIAKNNENAFHKKEGVFTELIDTNMIGQNAIGNYLRNNDQKTKSLKDSSNLLSSVNKSFLNFTPLKGNTMKLNHNNSRNLLNLDYNNNQNKKIINLKIKSVNNDLLDKYETEEVLNCSNLKKFDSFIKARQIVEKENLEKSRNLSNF